MIKRNIFANYGQLIIVGLLTILLLPVYSRNMVAQEWGVVAQCITWQSLLLIVDLGLSQAMPRDIAKCGTNFSAIRKIFKAYRFLYSAASGLIFFILFILLAVVFGFKMDVGSNPNTFIPYVVMIITCALTIFNSANVGLLNGVSAQYIAAGSRTTSAVLSHLVALTLVLVFNIDAIGYCVGFMCGALFDLALLSSYIRRVSKLWPPDLDNSESTQAPVGQVFRQAIGLSGAILIGSMVSQIDRLAQMSLLRLEDFGSYILVSTLGLAAYQLQYPVIRAWTPTLSRSVPMGTFQTEVKKLLKVIALTCVLPCVAGVAFSNQLLYLWKGSADFADTASSTLMLILSAVAINALYSASIYQSLLLNSKSKAIAAVNVFALLVAGGTWLAFEIFHFRELWAGGLIVLLVSFSQVVGGIFLVLASKDSKDSKNEKKRKFTY